MFNGIIHKIWMYFGYKRWLRNLVYQQNFLLKYFFIMNNGVYFFNKPCDKCKCYIEAGDVVRKYQDDVNE